MPKDKVSSGDIQGDLPELTKRVRPLQPFEKTLITRLTPVVDKIRQLNTTFGLRSYRVHLIHVQWSGVRVGDGTPIEISKQEILPTPKILDMGATTEVLRAFGLTEEGSVVIEEISANYTEDTLMGRTPDMLGNPVSRTNQRNTEFFWEVQEYRPGADVPPVPRRYVPAAVPMIGRDTFQWRVALIKQTLDRSRNKTFSRREE